jgi:subtilisin family serine protease
MGGDCVCGTQLRTQADDTDPATPIWERPTTHLLVATPNDPLYSNQKSFEQSSNVDINAARAWDFSKGSYTVKACIVDSGIDYDHPELGNGAFGSGAKVSGGYDYGNDDTDPDDKLDVIGHNYFPHGTAVAGILGAVRNNAVGVAGLAGGDGGAGNIGVQLIALKTADDDGDTTTDTFCEAITDGALSTSQSGFGCHLFNISLGWTSYSNAEREVLSFAANSGVITVAAKGNGGNKTKIYPGDYDASWISNVGATDDSDARLSGTSFGNGIDVAAPGASSMVHTTYSVEDGSYGSFELTSAATPHVAGLAALIKTASLERGLNLHPGDVEGLIKASAKKVRTDIYTYDISGWNENVGHGRIDAGKALEMLNTPYVLEQKTATGGTDMGIGATLIVQIYEASGLNEGVFYTVKRHEVRKTVSFSARQQAYVWGRGANASVGWSAVTTNNDLYGVGFAEVVPGTVTASSATMRTYVYEVYEHNELGQQFFKGWYPATPSNVTIAYTVLGVLNTAPPPFTVTISGPLELTWHQSGTLTATATGGSGAYTYLWFYRAGGTGNWISTGATTASISVDMVWTQGVEYKVEVSSAGSTTSDTHFISYGLATPGGMPIPGKDEAALPEAFSLEAAYPNPFNPVTTLRYALPDAATVRLVVYDLLGREVARLVEGVQQAGYHAVAFDGARLASGVYLYRLEAGAFVQTRRMTLVK